MHAAEAAVDIAADVADISSFVVDAAEAAQVGGFDDVALQFVGAIVVAMFLVCGSQCACEFDSGAEVDVAGIVGARLLGGISSDSGGVPICDRDETDGGAFFSSTPEEIPLIQLRIISVLSS